MLLLAVMWARCGGMLLGKESRGSGGSFELYESLRFCVAKAKSRSGLLHRFLLPMPLLSLAFAVRLGGGDASASLESPESTDS